MRKIKVTIWNEHLHETRIPEQMTQYPEGIHGAIAAAFADDDRFEVRTALMEEEDQGLSDALLDDTDVLIWWGHMAHQQVSDRLADKVAARVLEGMGFIPLHASRKSKPMMKLMGTTCSAKWREDKDEEKIWVIEPTHPIAAGLPECITLEREEMYGERCDFPRPDELIFISWYSGGEVGRSGCVWYRGRGRIFYFQPGHETFHSLNNEYIQRVIRNAAAWTANVNE